MSYSIEQFGFEPVEEIPVKQNDWAQMIEAFICSDASIIKRSFDSKSQASNAAAAIRKVIANLGVNVEVVNKNAVIYLRRESFVVNDTPVVDQRSE